MALKIPAIAGQVHLGCTAQERKIAQPVQLAIEIQFAKTPKAVTSDSIKDTPCYAEMTKLVQETFAKKHYATIEHLCHCCHLDLKKYLKQHKSCRKSVLSTTLKKISPPVKEILEGSLFSITQKI